MITVYIAHEYGGNPANRAAAAKWCAFFARLGYNPSAMWIVLTGEWDESMRQVGLACDREMIRRSDVLVQVGPSVSSGMEVEDAFAEDFELPYVCLVGGFPDTPDGVSCDQKLEIIRRINSVVEVS